LPNTWRRRDALLQARRILVIDRDHWVQLLSARPAEGVSRPQRICELCVEMLGVTGGGISVVTAAGNRGVVCATDDVAAQIEDLQFTLGVGPCMDAVSSGAPVMVNDLDALEDVAGARWTGFLKTASEIGVRAVFALPLRIGAISIGAIDLYRDTPGELSNTQLPAALLAADAAALALLAAADDPLDQLGEGLGEWPARGHQIHQATGMVQVQLGVSTEAALLSLRARAFSAGRPLGELANDVVQRRVRLTLEDEG